MTTPQQFGRSSDVSRKGLVRSVLTILILSYIGFGCLAYFVADKIAFQPPRATYRDNADSIRLKVKSGNEISCVYLANATASHTILFSHGNAEDLGITRSTLEDLREAGFAVFAFDYEGYGTSTGSPSEQRMYENEEAAYDYLTSQLNIPPSRIIAHGRSLGGVAAIDLASRKPLAGLIIESSFVSGFRVMTGIPLFPFDKFRNAAKLKRVTCPVLVMHGKRDEVISFWHGEKLYETANEPKMFLWIDEAGHNDFAFIANERYTNALRDFQAMISKNAKREYDD